MYNWTKTRKLVPVVVNYPSLVNIFNFAAHQRDVDGVLFMYAEYQVIISTTCNKPIIIIDKPL